MTLLSPVFAQIGNPAINVDTNQTGTEFISKFLAQMISIIIVVGGLAFFFMFAIGAVRWITSGGDKGSVESARSQITHALAGLFVMFSLWAIAKLVETVIGIDLLLIDLTPLLAV